MQKFKSFFDSSKLLYYGIKSASKEENISLRETGLGKSTVLPKYIPTHDMLGLLFRYKVKRVELRDVAGRVLHQDQPSSKRSKGQVRLCPTFLKGSTVVTLVNVQDVWLRHLSTVNIFCCILVEYKVHEVVVFVIIMIQFTRSLGT